MTETLDETILRKTCLNLEGTVDLYLIMEGMREGEDLLPYMLPSNLNFNLIEFTPKTSHRMFRKREQSVVGEINPSRYALIVDDGWWEGNSLRECLSYLLEKGYSHDKIYSFYFTGSPAHAKREDLERYSIPLGGKAFDILNYIEKANKEILENAKH